MKYEDQCAEGFNHKSTIQISMSINSQWSKHQFGTKRNPKGNIYKAQQGSYMIDNSNEHGIKLLQDMRYEHSLSF